MVPCFGFSSSRALPVERFGRAPSSPPVGSPSAQTVWASCLELNTSCQWYPSYSASTPQPTEQTTTVAPITHTTKACERACHAGTQHVHSRETHQIKPSLAVPKLWTPSSCVCRSQRRWWARVRYGSMQPSLGTSAPGCTHEATMRWWWCFVWAYLSCQNTTRPYERVPRWLPTVIQWLASLPEHEIQGPLSKCARLAQQWDLTLRTLDRSRAFFQDSETV